MVNFLPFQDALSNPHVSLAKLKKEFPEELADETRITLDIFVVSGKKVFWGADSVSEVGFCWCIMYTSCDAVAISAGVEGFRFHIRAHGRGNRVGTMSSLRTLTMPVRS
jgi:hypothetical protein